MIPKKRTEHPCSDCLRLEMKDTVDGSAYRRSRRAVVWDPAVERRVVDKKIVERIVGG